MNIYNGQLFDGETYDHGRDGRRLGSQMESVYNLILCGQWMTLEAISSATGAPQASVSARLRDLRKRKFGEHRVERRYVRNGLFEYRLAKSNDNQ